MKKFKFKTFFCFFMSEIKTKKIEFPTVFVLFFMSEIGKKVSQIRTNAENQTVWEWDTFSLSEIRMLSDFYTLL